MRKITSLLVTAGVFLGIAGSVYAETLERVTATVPFTFVVNGAKLPAGDYLITKVLQTDPSTLMIQSRDGRHSAFFAENVGGTGEPRLVFDVVDGEHYLREVGSSFGSHTAVRSNAEAKASGSGNSKASGK